jgi:pimeloyl-ACP methyl ester carboxylesterase
MTMGRWTGSRGSAATALVALLALSACASSPPLSVSPGDPWQVREERQVNALTGAPSESTRIVLRRRDFLEESERDPAAVIEKLHEFVVRDEATRETLFTLAELSFLLANEQVAARQTPHRQRRTRAIGRPRSAAPAEDPLTRARERYLAAAVYAWAYLFADREGDDIVVLDPRAPLAAELYNHAVAAAFSTKNGSFEPRAGDYPLPFGSLEVGFDPSALEWGMRRLTAFQPVASFEVRGLRNRYRQPGIGAPLVASAVAHESWRGLGDLGLAETMVSATAVLVLEDPGAQLRGSNLQGRIELYRGREATSLEIHGRRVPLEIEPSVALAATLERSGVWEGELSAFLGRAVGVERRAQLFALEPLTPGQTPVVFVHGTNSNPSVWANMANDLLSHPRIREHFSFWFFAYDSGNPILYSGMMLRRALSEIAAVLAPTGSYPCFRDMVVIGHSQGGLLTKLTAIDSGTRFWDSVTRKPFDEFEFRPETRAVLREATFVEPLPFVTRVVFIATPHRGSFLASPLIVRRLARRLIRLPLDLVEISTDLAGLTESASTELRIARVATSLDNMSPGNRFVRTLAEIPVAAGVAQNSIVAVRGDGPPEDGDDGVVRFVSAHRPDADSELIVRSGHSTQSNPHTVNEVERILGLHADRSTCAAGR